MTSSRTSLITVEKNSKWPTYCDFLPFTSIIWPCGRNNDFKFNNGGRLLSSVLLFTYITCFNKNYITVHVIIIIVLNILSIKKTQKNSNAGGDRDTVNSKSSSAVEGPGRLLTTGAAVVEGPGGLLAAGASVTEGTRRLLATGAAVLEGPGRLLTAGAVMLEGPGRLVTKGKTVLTGPGWRLTTTVQLLNGSGWLFRTGAVVLKGKGAC